MVIGMVIGVWLEKFGCLGCLIRSIYIAGCGFTSVLVCGGGGGVQPCVA